MPDTYIAPAAIELSCAVPFARERRGGAPRSKASTSSHAGRPAVASAPLEAVPLQQFRVRTEVVEPVYRLGEVISVSGGLGTKIVKGDDYVFACTYADGRKDVIVRRVVGETSRSWIARQ